ncbi:4-hydroxybenzoate transporter PcaK [Cupriavidus basilensis OR16]|uniref:4-hydroxybenzoate transporter PcaK n=2 Tax=Cupriavidus basilensis TaxID=68895 RepID=H1S8P3_9BURK|nr:4-hydroxybenzoate transporter PcaK [Cupriavidus basilensis OR16]
MTDDIGTTLRRQAMLPFQFIVVAICIAINVLDGFDALASAFTAPSIAREWGLRPTALGFLLSASLAGMAIGSVLIAPFGDRIGRRPIVLGCLVLVSATMLASAAARNVWQLAALRLVTGLGVGGIIPGINTLVAEYASARRRDLALSMTTVGYAVGAILGGAVSGFLIGNYGWRAAFLAGGVLSALMVPVAVIWLPESLDILAMRQPRHALDRLNGVLRKLGQPALRELPAKPAHAQARSAIRTLFQAELRRATVLTCACYLLVMLTNYFLLSWTPKILVDMGMSVQSGISGAVVMNLAGVIGGIVLGWLTGRYGLRRISVAYLSLCFLSVAWFGFMSASSPGLFAATALIGFLITGAVACLNALAPRMFSPDVRTTGTGLALGFGRLGGTAGPYLAGLLIAAGWSRPIYSIALAAPLLAAALIFSLALAKEGATT